MRGRLARLSLAAFLALSCASRKEPSAAVAQAPATEKAAEAAPRKIVHTGVLRLEIESYESSRQELEAIVTGAGGFVGSTQVHHGDGRVVAADLTLRIPSARFREVTARLRQLGRVIDESTQAEDVTEAWVDLEARLKNARQMETRLLEIVAKGPEKVADLLEVERELARVRGEIEGYEGRMRVMRDHVELGTLQVGLYTDEKHVPPTVGSRAVGTLERSWNALLAFGETLLLIGLALVPWLPPILLLGWLGRRFWRRRHLKASS